MRHPKRIVIALLAALSATAAPSAADEWTNTLKPKGNPSAPLTLVRDGQPAFSILIPATATPVEKKAAADLQQWVKEITGATLPIDSKAAGPGVIRLATDVTMDAEGYRIDVSNGSLILTGSPGRGVVNAVYALLEEDLGCRWYTKTSVRLPRTKTLAISPVPRSYTPQLKLRDPFFHVSFDPDWSLRNRTNAPDAKVSEEHGGHIDYGGHFVHTFAGLLPPDKHFKEHPEYYFLDAAGNRNPAQLCTTHPDVHRLVTENVLAVLAKHPETEIISVSKNDSGGDQICRCERCTAVRTAEGAEMGVQLVLVNHVADAVAQKYPKVMIDTLAYLDTIGVPKTARPRKNVIVRFCNDAPGAWSHPFTPAEKCPIAKTADAWAAAHDKLSVWDYHVNFSHYLAPMPNVDVIAANIRYWAKKNAWGVMTQAGYQGAAERDELKSWVIAKLLWDPTRDENALVQDFLLGHYGPAAPALIEYDALLVKAGKDHAAALASPPGGIRYPMDAAFLTKDFIDQSTALFAKAKKLAGSDETILHRVERAELPILYVKLSRGPQFSPDFAQVFADFSRIAKREGATHLAEVWPANLDAQLAAWQKQVPAPATKPASTQQASSPHKVISKGDAALSYQAFPDMTRLKNGDLLAVFYAGYGHVSLSADDFPLGGRICMTRSSDDGKTWSAPEVLFDDGDDNRDGHVTQLADGTLVCTFFSWKHKGERFKSIKDFNWKTFDSIATPTGAQIVTSADNGKTWDKTARTLFPDWFCSAPVRQLKDGTLLLGLYAEDPKTKLARGGVTRSADGGKTWSTPVEIPGPPGISLAAETDLIELPDGRLFAALRSDKHNMHFSTSSDKGLTWTPAADIGFKGHCPHLTRLSTGPIILSHRLPNTSIHISRDDARTWQGPYEIDKVFGAYPATVELKDGTVLIVYYTEGKNSEVRTKRFKVTPDGIEFLPVS